MSAPSYEVAPQDESQYQSQNYYPRSMTGPHVVPPSYYSEDQMAPRYSTGYIDQVVGRNRRRRGGLAQAGDARHHQYWTDYRYPVRPECE